MLTLRGLWGWYVQEVESCKRRHIRDRLVKEGVCEEVAGTVAVVGDRLRGEEEEDERQGTER